MGKTLLLLSLLLPLSVFSSHAQTTLTEEAEAYPVSPEKQRFLGKPVYIRIIKEEKTLELFIKDQGNFRLVQTYPICNYSGGLGPKRSQETLKALKAFIRSPWEA